MTEPAISQPSDARGADTWRGAATFLLPFALAALWSALSPATLAGASLGTQAITAASAAGSYSVVVTTPGAWTASANDTFLHTSASGTGNGLAVFTVDAFTGTGTRTGTLSIAGMTVTVTQAGTDYIAVNAVTTRLSAAADGVAVDGAGDIFMSIPWSGTEGNQLLELSLATGVNTLVASGEGLNNPSGLAVDGSGNVYIANTSYNEVLEYVPAFLNIRTLVASTQGLSGPTGLALDASGNVYFADTGNSAIKEWSVTTETVSTVASSGNGLSSPTGVALDASANIYIADTGNNAIKVWNSTTQDLSTLVSTGLSGPAGVAVDGSGNVYIADHGDNAIEEWIAATGMLTTLVSTGLSGPADVAVDGSGNVYIADYGDGAVKELPNAFVGPASLTEPAAAGSDSLNVLPATQPLTGMLGPASDSGWLTIGTVSGGVVNFSFTANTSTARTAHIKVLGMSIPVMQSGPQATVMNVTSTAANGTYGTAAVIPITVTFTEAVTVTGTPQLILNSGGVANYSSGSGTSTLTFTYTVAAGQSAAWLECASVSALMLNGGTIDGSASASAVLTLPTPGAAGSLSANKSIVIETDASQTITFGAIANRAFSAGGTLGISASASSGLAVTFTSLTASICTVSASTLSTGTSSATVTQVAAGQCAIEATQAGSANYAAATAVDQTFQLIQPSLGTTAILVGSAAGSSSVIVTTARAWTAASNASFLHVAPASTSGTSSATVIFTIDAFTGTGMRSGTLTIAGLTLTVTQAGANYVQVTGLTTLVPATAGLKGPSDVAVDGAGDVFISDSHNGMIKKWSATAQTLSTLVSSGLADAQGLAVDVAGNVFIADYGRSEIQEWNAANGLVAVVSSGLRGPCGVAVDAFDNIYIADSGDQAGKEWTAATGTLSTLVLFGQPLPWGAAVDSAGNVYISDTDNSRITKWNASTQTAATLVASNLNAPAGITVDGSGNIWIANSDNSQIREWNASTQKVTTLVSTGLNYPMGVAVDGSNNLYIADTFNNAIEELPHAFVGPVSMSEQPAAGSDALLQVLPATEPLIGIFAPSSDSSWLSIGTIANGVVSFNFTANTAASARTANITILGMTIPVTQLAAQSISFGPLSDQVYGTPPFAVSASASSGLAVSLASLTTSVCTVSSGTVTLVSVGKCTIEATQSGSASYAAATPVDQSFQVTQGSQNIAFDALSNVAYGTAPFAISASASSGLMVSFGSTTTGVCTVSASTLMAGVSYATVTLLAGGPCSIQAAQTGNVDYLPAGSVTEGFTVTQAQASLTLSAPAVTYGVSASVGVTVVTTLAKVPTGSITLTVDSGVGVTKTLSGGAAAFSVGILPAGSHTLSVTYSGNTDFQTITAAQAAALLGSPVLVVNKAATAVALAVSGQTAKATVSVTPPGAGTPTGSIQFQRGTTVLGTVSLSGLMATLANVGPGAATAVYSGDSNFNSSTSSTQTVYVPTSALSIASSVNPSTLGQLVTFTATISNGDAPPAITPTGTVQFFDGTTALGAATVSNSQATYATAMLGGGTHQIVAKYSGDSVFPSAQASYGQSVSAVTAVSLSVSPAAPAYGQPVTVTATVTSVTAAAGFAAPTGTVTFVLGGRRSCRALR